MDVPQLLPELLTGGEVAIESAAVLPKSRSLTRRRDPWQHGRLELAPGAQDLQRESALEILENGGYARPVAIYRQEESTCSGITTYA